MIFGNLTDLLSDSAKFCAESVRKSSVLSLSHCVGWYGAVFPLADQSPGNGSNSGFTEWAVKCNMLLMKCIRYVYWQDGDAWLGHLEEYPDYLTQGESLSDLEEHLRDLHKDLSSGVIPSVRKLAELMVS
jgi:hypothetical protein